MSPSRALRACLLVPRPRAPQQEPRHRLFRGREGSSGRPPGWHVPGLSPPSAGPRPHAHTAPRRPGPPPHACPLGGARSPRCSQGPGVTGRGPTPRQVLCQQANTGAGAGDSGGRPRPVCPARAWQPRPLRPALRPQRLLVLGLGRHHLLQVMCDPGAGVSSQKGPGLGKAVGVRVPQAAPYSGDQVRGPRTFPGHRRGREAGSNNKQRVSEQTTRTK